jgi:two-component system cell cycle sensor histidine kinase/response regulator CckA
VQGVLLDANQTALALVDVQLRDVIGRPFWETPWWSHSSQEVDKLKAGIAQAATGAFVRFETNILAKDGTLRTLDVSLKPVMDASGNVTRLIPEGRDITALKQSERERVSLTAQLHQAQRLEALGRLAGGIAHDFNNLLTVIGGNLSILQTFEAAGSEQHDALAECQQASVRAVELTRQLLTFSRRQVVEPRVVDPTECLDGLQKLLRRVVGDHIRFTATAQGEPGRLLMDPSQFEQIVMNLVVNARDSMPSGGSIDIVLRHHDGAIPNAAAGFQDPDASYVLLAVTDTGSGIDDSVIEHIFEPFFTTKDASSGTGLGLATAHGIVTHMSGHIAVDSRIGQGTIFEIYLPCCHEQIMTLSTAPSARQDTLSGAGDSVLVVEDQTSVRDLVTRILRHQGFSVSAFADGAGALNFASNLTNRFDIVLTDVVMPNMGGRALADAIRQLRPEVPIVFMSGQSDDPVVQQSVSAMALVHTLRAALARRNDSND